MHEHSGRNSARIWRAERFSRGCRSLCLLLKRGRSAPFADPASTALEAHHVWLPEAGTSVFPASAQAADTSAPEHTSVFIPALPSLERILIDAAGRQHVVLRANGASFQLCVEGVDVSAGPVTITLLVRGISDLSRASGQLLTLRRILSATSRPHVLSRWTPTTRKLRDALVALDGRAAQASYRDIAIVLHGVAYVDRFWERGLKYRMRRHFRRGLALSQGGYRDLLR